MLNWHRECDEGQGPMLAWPDPLLIRRGLHGRRQLSGIDLLGVMEAAAQHDRSRNSGKGNEDAHV